MEWILIIQNTVLQMLVLIIPPQGQLCSWCSLPIGGEVAFGSIFKGCFGILLTQELSFICISV